MLKSSNIQTIGSRIGFGDFKDRLTFSEYSSSWKIFESAGKVIICDLIGEGSIDGIVNEYGEDVSPVKNYVDNDNIYKGIYLNDLPVKNTITNQFNFTLLNTNFKFGNQFQKPIVSSSSLDKFKEAFNNQEFDFTNPSVSYDYDKVLYGLEKNLAANFFNSSSKAHQSIIKRIDSNKTTNLPLPIDRLFTQENFQKCFGVHHEIRDKGTKFLIITFKQNNLFSTDKKGNVLPLDQYLGISLNYKNAELPAAYILHRLYGTTTAPYQFDLYLDISDIDIDSQPVVKIYNFSERLSPAEVKRNRSLSVVAVTEMQGAQFSYPNSAYVINEIDSRSIGSIPNRSYDLHLLKVKVPINYDPEAKKYYGNWNGDFDSVLRWTNNPAWILYDIITNQRYGVGKFTKDAVFLNKWSAFEIAKYCDGLVSTKNPSKYLPVKICDIYDRNSICLSWTAEDEEKIGASFDDLFGNRLNNEIALVNLKFYDPITENYYYKCFKGFVVGLNRAENKIYLANDFGISKIMSMFDGVYDWAKENGSDASVLKKIISGQLSLRDYADANFFTKINGFLQGKSNFSNLNVDTDDLYFFTEDEVQYYVPNSGQAACVFRDEGYKDLLEPRFTANFYLTNDTQIFDLINNISSIFRGIAYWNNFVLNFNSDKKDYPVYAFSNANVKEGLFSYSGSSKDNRYTVCKVLYSDKDDFFRDKTIYVEDYRGIKDYGYIEREIIGFGVTSETQARRIGRWFLLTNQIEKDVVTFSTGQEANLLNIGDVITISDQFKLSAPRAGRIFNFATDGSYVLTLDNRYDFISPNDKISIVIPAFSLSENKIKDADKNKNTYVYSFVVDEVEVITSDDDFRTQITLTISSSDDEKAYGQIRKNSMWIFEEKYESDVKYNKEYRVISIKEKENGEFEISALEYAFTKFDYLDFDKELEIPALVSNESALEENGFVPTDMLSSINEKVYLENPDGEDVASVLVNALCSQPLAYDGSISYDYIFDADEFVNFNYFDTFEYRSFDLSNFYLKCLSIPDVINDINAIKGFVVEVVINYKKVSFRWSLSDEKAIYNIAYPKKEFSESVFDIRVYKVGNNGKILS